MKIIVILPTYNEKDNIEPMIGALQEQFRKIPHDMNLLVVDDNSPDGTAGIVRAEGKKASNIFFDNRAEGWAGRRLCERHEIRDQ